MPNDATTTAPAGVKRSRLRRVRIATSVFFAVVTVAVCVLWVRSYFWIDNVVGPVTIRQQFGVASANGWLTLRTKSPPLFRKWSVQSRTPAQLEAVYEQLSRGGGQVTRPGPKRLGFIGDGAIQFPHLLPAVLFAILAALPWISCRYSLRTLLIATTLVAVVLGLGIWAAK